MCSGRVLSGLNTPCFLSTLASIIIFILPSLYSAITPLLILSFLVPCSLAVDHLRARQLWQALAALLVAGLVESAIEPVSNIVIFKVAEPHQPDVSAAYYYAFQPLAACRTHFQWGPSTRL